MIKALSHNVVLQKIDTTARICKSGILAISDTGSPVVLKILIFCFAVRVHSRRALRFICTALSSPAVHAGPGYPRHSGPAPSRLANPNRS
jgi:hypothetical protein